ncbi:hypothetical protein FGIG_04202 [Fasciola gigantica]|uniref:Uncharacterized protein n=1 Tax=Fasciola gigantica TaxID=46835 RepID=A0A504YMY1_FASGI|nr:hypothetical protein FGIG_04202 [Fasciola gigantica]
MGNGQSSLYLLHYCNGGAQEVFKECLMLPPSGRYNRACEVRKKVLSGLPRGNAMNLNGLMKEFNASGFGSEALSTVAVRMESCMTALERMDFTPHFNSPWTPERIISNFSYTLQSKRTERVDRLTQPETRLYLKPSKRDIDDLDRYASNVNLESARFQSGQLTEDRFCCPVFICDLRSPTDTNLRTRLLAPSGLNSTPKLHDGVKRAPSTDHSHVRFDPQPTVRLGLPVHQQGPIIQRSFLCTTTAAEIGHHFSQATDPVPTIWRIYTITAHFSAAFSAASATVTKMATTKPAKKTNPRRSLSNLLTTDHMVWWQP